MTQKIAYVTGGMGGIGTAICQRLAKDGFKVIAGCGPTRDAGKWLDEQKALGYSFYASVGNVGDWDSTVAAFDKVKAEHGQVSVLVNNAGITRDGQFRKMSKADWDAVISTNLNSMFNVTKQVIEGMIEANFGRVVNISSVNGQKGQFGQVNYSTAKAGLHGFTMALAQELASKGVTVNTVSPGYIGTDMVKYAGSLPESSQIERSIERAQEFIRLPLTPPTCQPSCNTTPTWLVRSSLAPAYCPPQASFPPSALGLALRLHPAHLATGNGHLRRGLVDRLAADQAVAGRFHRQGADAPEHVLAAGVGVLVTTTTASGCGMWERASSSRSSRATGDCILPSVPSLPPSPGERRRAVN